MLENRRHQIKFAIESVLKQYVFPWSKEKRDVFFSASHWEAVVGPAKDGKIIVTVAPEVYSTKHKPVTTEHTDEVERALREHLPTKLAGCWRSYDVKPLGDTVVVWLDCE